MKINVSGVMRKTDASIEADGEVSVPFINYKGDNIKVLSPIKVHVLIANNDRNLLATGKITALLMLNCSRCLEDFEYLLETDFEEELSNKNDEVDAVHFEGDTVDLIDIVINNILLSLPMKVICSEECKGLCPHCGSNLNIKQCECSHEEFDPRFSVLKDLLKGD